MLKNRHILVLPKWYPNPEYESAGIFVQRHIESVLPHTNISVLYVAASTELKGFSIRKEYKKEKGIDTLRFYYGREITGISFLDRFLKLFLYFFCLKKGYSFLEKKKNKIDLIHVTVLLRTGIFAWIKNKFTGTPYIITEHWTGYLPMTGHYKKNGLKKLLTPSIIKNAELISPASDDLGKAMKTLGLNNEYFTVHNVVDTDFFKPDFNHKNTIPKILTVAMLLDEHKNISGILRTLKKIKDEGINFEYHIFGKGEDEKKLKNHSIELGLKKNVFFHGLQPPDRIAKEMRNADFFLLFSNYENLPCVIIEAMASGIPVLSSDVGGISEMIQNKKVGELIPAQDEKLLFEKIKHFISHNSTYDKKYISEFAKSNFGKEHIGLRIRKMYESIFK